MTNMFENIMDDMNGNIEDGLTWYLMKTEGKWPGGPMNKIKDAEGYEEYHIRARTIYLDIPDLAGENALIVALDQYIDSDDDTKLTELLTSIGHPNGSGTTHNVKNTDQDEERTADDAVEAGTKQKEKPTEDLDDLFETEQSEFADKDIMIREGFHHYADVEEAHREELAGWLEKTGVQYLEDDDGHFFFNCPDREREYKVKRYLQHIKGQKFNRTATALKPINNFSDKKDFDRPVPREPLFGSIEEEESNKKKEKLKNTNLAKYPVDTLDEGNEMAFLVGDSVTVNGNEGKVKIANGPKGTVGVVVNETLRMYPLGQVKKLKEGAMGMVSLNNLKRLRELAGMPPEPVGAMPPGPLAPGSVPVDINVTQEDPMDDFGVTPALGGNVSELPPEETLADIKPMQGQEPLSAIDFDEMPVDDFDDEFANEFDDDIDGEIPGGEEFGDVDPLASPVAPLGGMDMGMGVVAEMGGTYADIESKLAEIEAAIPNLKISEYKPLISRLESTLSAARSKGLECLQETHIRRVKTR